LTSNKNDSQKALLAGVRHHSQQRLLAETNQSPMQPRQKAGLLSYWNDLSAKRQGKTVNDALIQQSRTLASAAIANKKQTARLLIAEGFTALNTAKYYLTNTNAYMNEKILETT
jgi:hypothetical protein